MHGSRKQRPAGARARSVGFGTWIGTWLSGCGLLWVAGCTQPSEPMSMAADAAAGVDEPPRIGWDKRLVPTSELVAPQRGRGLRPVRGLIHLHSPYSHDACDDNPQPGGKPNQPCLDHLRKAVCTTRQDFAMLTDHATHMGEAAFDKLFHADEAAGDVLLREGSDVLGARWRCDLAAGPADPPDRPYTPGSTAADKGHTVLITVGGENDLMPVGLRRHLGATEEQRKKAMSDGTPAAIPVFKQAGAVVLQAHGESRTRDKMIELAKAGLGGMEVYNLHANIDPKIRDPYLGLDPLGAIIGLSPWLDGIPVDKGGPEPDLSVLGFLLPNPPQLAHYDALLGLGYRPHPTLGSDIHENAFKLELADGERGDSYRRLMRWFTNHLLVPVPASPTAPPAPAELKEALEQRRGYGVFEVLGPPHGFDFYADGRDASQRGELGAEVAQGATLHLRPPMPLPQGDRRKDTVMRVVVLRVAPGATGSQVVLEQRLSAAELAAAPELTVATATAGPGAYRVEIHVTPLHLLHLLGKDAARYQKEYPYLYSAPIFVRATPPI